MNVVDLPSKKLPTLDELHADFMDLVYNKYEDLSIAATLGVLEIVKWELINQIPESVES